MAHQACAQPRSHPFTAPAASRRPPSPQHDVQRVHAGSLVTSLDMAGISLTLMACDDARLAALDAPTAAPGWPPLGGKVEVDKPLAPLPAAVLEARARRAGLLRGRPLAAAAPEGRAFEAAVRAAAAVLLGLRQRLNEVTRSLAGGPAGRGAAGRV